MNFAPADAYQLCLALPGSFLTMLGTPFCAALYKMDLHSSTHSVSCYQSRWQEQGSYSCLQFSWHQEQSLHTNSSISTCWPTPPWRSATRCRKDSPAQHSGLSVTYTKNWVKHGSQDSPTHLNVYRRIPPEIGFWRYLPRRPKIETKNKTDDFALHVWISYFQRM